MNAAVTKLNNTEFKGQTVRCTADVSTHKLSSAHRILTICSPRQNVSANGSVLARQLPVVGDITQPLPVTTMILGAVSIRHRLANIVAAVHCPESTMKGNAAMGRPAVVACVELPLMIVPATELFPAIQKRDMSTRAVIPDMMNPI